MSSGLKNVSALTAKFAPNAFALGYHFHRSNCTAWEWNIHTMQYHTAPPVDIVTLINQTMLPGTQDAEECRKLLELYKSGHKDAPYMLTCELASSIDERIRLWLNKHPEQEKRDLQTLDEFFRSMVLR